MEAVQAAGNRESRAAALATGPPPPLQLFARHKRGSALLNVAQEDPFVAEPESGYTVALSENGSGTPEPS